MTSEQQAAMADRIRALLDAKGASLSRLAKEAGVAKGYLWQMLRGEATNPGLDVVRKIAAALDVPVAQLLGEEPASAARGLPDDLPPALREFVERARERGTPLGAEDIEMLRGIRYRGRMPQTADDFALLYDMVRRIVE